VKRWGSESVETELHGSPAMVNFANPRSPPEKATKP